jgi:hypothetical protein
MARGDLDGEEWEAIGIVEGEWLWWEIGGEKI